MAKDIFSNLDLNLLRTFIILHQEKNMRKASDRLAVSQPTISKSLQKLRDHFNDELLVRTQYGLESTPFAEDLAESLSPLLDSLSLVVNRSQEFKPEELNGTLKVALSPFILSSISAELYLAIQQEAPNVDIHLLNWSKSTIEELNNDELHLAVNYDIQHAPKTLARKKLIKDSLKVYLRKDHPHKEDTINIKPGFEYSFASIIVPDWNSHQAVAEKIMKDRGITPRIAFRSELPSAIVDVVSQSDMIFPASRLFNIDKYPQLRSVDVFLDDFSIEPDIYAYYRSKNRNDATVQWLTRLIKQTIDG
ncbi:LysR family transcriptional regulator [Vibrio lamellibrachiae]|uniref:LysR family transcriptional regulator n=1 Tax=Vibrio lamellibrachiae TaxID=2910253 RepID=UPI003D150918